MMKYFKFLIFILLIYLCENVFGQISQGGIPYGFDLNFKKTSSTSVSLSKIVPSIISSDIVLLIFLA